MDLSSSVNNLETVSAPEVKKVSYQRSLRGQLNSHPLDTEISSWSSLHRMVEQMRKAFSMEESAKYEQPPGTGEDDGDDEDAFRIEGGNDSAARLKEHMKSHAGVNHHCRALISVLVLALTIATIKFWVDSEYPSNLEIRYTGDAPVCDRDETLLQSLRTFSTLEDVKNGAVASDHPKCSEIGLSMLRDYHGNAVDAAVATALCLGVANPSSSGIGGGAFMLIHAEATPRESVDIPEFHDARPDQKPIVNNGKITEVIDCREVAGSAATTLMYEAEGVAGDASVFGGLAVAVPGELRGLELAHARHGRLDWKTVVQPAMELARNGIPVYPHLANDIAAISLRHDTHDGLPTLRSLLTHNNNWDRPLKEGELIKNVKLADTLEAIMDNGADALYTGDRAQQLVDDLQKAGGILTKEDLEQYRPTLRSPLISDNVFGLHIVGVPPPSSGGATIIGALRFLAGYDTSPLVSFADTLTVHHMIEALRHVFSIRMSMGDPDFPIGNEVTNATTQDAVDALTSGPYMEHLRQASSDYSMLNLSQYGGKKFAQLHDSDGQKEVNDAKEGDRRRRLGGGSLKHRRLADPFGYLNDDGTSHFSVIDKDGNSVAMTTSVNSRFGSCVVSETTGVLLNNQMNGKYIIVTCTVIISGSGNPSHSDRPIIA